MTYTLPTNAGEVRVSSVGNTVKLEVEVGGTTNTVSLYPELAIKLAAALLQEAMK